MAEQKNYAFLELGRWLKVPIFDYDMAPEWWARGMRRNEYPYSSRLAARSLHTDAERVLSQYGMTFGMHARTNDG